MNNKRCGTCRHWRGAPIEGHAGLGVCAFPMPKALPKWVRSAGSTSLETDGRECDAWDPSDDLHALCGEIIQTLRENYMGGPFPFPFVDNATFEALLDGWSKRLKEIKR